MGFVKACSVNDLKPGGMRGFLVAGKPVLLVNLDGTYYAMGNVCTHMGCTLAEGRLKDGTVQCPCHASVFDVKTGNVLKGPATVAELRYEVKIEGIDVLVNV
jgi:3-phenylpropionate/trans-cinnamate dioxygenase ferredoxin subunit